MLNRFQKFMDPRTSNVNLSLTRMQDLLKKLGDPHKFLPPTIHIAGTNGKGSTLAFLESICKKAKLKVHKYTSPHLVKYNERIIISNQVIKDTELYQLFMEIHKYSIELELTPFEMLTGIALLSFARNSADILLLETGMGGRLDATNVILDPLVSIITPIGLDHTEFLGNTILDIAKEKAGILKKNGRCVFGVQEDIVLNILSSIAQSLNCRTHAYNQNWIFIKTETGFVYKGDEVIKIPYMDMEGDHQLSNAATAIAALESCKGYLNITEDKIIQGISSTMVPARMEQIINNELCTMLKKDDELWFDGAHNVMGAKALANTLNTLPKKHTFIIHSRSKYHDVLNFLLLFQDITEHIIAISLPNKIGIDPHYIQKTAVAIGFKSVVKTNIESAIQYCIQNTSCNIRIVICGSLHIATSIYQRK